jgi:hypothetical protein
VKPKTYVPTTSKEPTINNLIISREEKRLDMYWIWSCLRISLALVSYLVRDLSGLLSSVISFKSTRRDQSWDCICMFSATDVSCGQGSAANDIIYLKFTVLMMITMRRGLSQQCAL